MNANLFFQGSMESSIYNNIEEEFKNNPKKVYIFLGKIKEDGFELLEEQLIDCESKIYIALGIDKKNTTKSILDGLLKFTSDIYVYNNNNIKEFECNMFVFEYTSYANIYVSSATFSKIGITDNIAVYTKLEYDLKNKEEKKEYNNILNEFLSKYNSTKGEEQETEGFKKLDKNMIETLINNKDIFSTRQYIHNVKSISELLGKNKEKSEDESTNDTVKEENNKQSIEIPKIDVDDDNFDISIDISDIDDAPINIKEEKADIQDNIQNDIEISDIKNDKELNNNLYNENFGNDEYTDFDEFNDKIDKNSELYDEELENVNFDENETLDIDKLLFSKVDAKLELDNETRIDKKDNLDKSNDLDNEFSDEEVVKVKKLNLNNISNYIFELPSKPKSGNATESIRIPNYIRKMIPEFFEIENTSNTIENGISYKKRKIVLEIVDVKNNLKYNDNNAEISYKNGQTFISFDSNVIGNIEYNEYDIARIIKLSSNIYHIEIISKDIQEYKIWKKLCTQKLKSVDRMYGMM